MKVTYKGPLRVSQIVGGSGNTWFYVPEKGVAVQLETNHQMGNAYKTNSPILEWLQIGVQVIIVVDQALPVLKSIFDQIWIWITATKEEKAAIKAVRIAKKK